MSTGKTRTVEAAAPPLITLGCPAQGTGPPLRPQGCCASLTRRPCGPALTPETTAAPQAGSTGRPGLPPAARGTSERTARQRTITKSEVSTVSGDCQDAASPQVQPQAQGRRRADGPQFATACPETILFPSPETFAELDRPDLQALNGAAAQQQAHNCYAERDHAPFARISRGQGSYAHRKVKVEATGGTHSGPT